MFEVIKLVKFLMFLFLFDSFLLFVMMYLVEKIVLWSDFFIFDLFVIKFFNIEILSLVLCVFEDLKFGVNDLIKF